MDDPKNLKFFTNLATTLGICVKDRAKRVVHQNEKSAGICGEMKDYVCQKGCMSLYRTVEECVEISEGLKFFRGVEIEGHKVDALVVTDGEQITSMFYTLGEQDEKFKKQEAFFRERGLTKSEVRIMQLVTQGMTNAAISEKLFISKVTLKTHLNNIYKKLPESMRPGLRGRN